MSCHFSSFQFVSYLLQKIPPSASQQSSSIILGHWMALGRIKARNPGSSWETSPYPTYERKLQHFLKPLFERGYVLVFLDSRSSDTKLFFACDFLIVSHMICYWFVKVTDYEVRSGIEENHLPKLLGSLGEARITWESLGPLNRITKNTPRAPHPWHRASAPQSWDSQVVSYRFVVLAAFGMVLLVDNFSPTRKRGGAGSVSIGTGAMSSFKKNSSRNLPFKGLYIFLKLAILPLTWTTKTNALLFRPLVHPPVFEFLISDHLLTSLFFGKKYLGWDVTLLEQKCLKRQMLFKEMDGFVFQP